MYKLVAIDIDGTLLNSRGEITNKTVETIKKVSNREVKVVLTSGRVTNSVKAIAQMIDASPYLICDNGASIYNVSTEETIWSKEIDKSTVIDLVKLFDDNNIYYMIFTDQEIIVKNLKHMALVFYMQRHNCVDENSGISQFKYAGLEYISQITSPIRRIVVCDEDRAIFNSIINKLTNFSGISLMASPFVAHKVMRHGDRSIVLSYSYAELLPEDTNKWSAISELMARFHLSSSEVVAIGDNFNDIQMIQNAGLGVAMNNGASVAKNVARIIAPSNDENGVALILERYVLRKLNENKEGGRLTFLKANRLLFCE